MLLDLCSLNLVYPSHIGAKLCWPPIFSRIEVQPRLLISIFTPFELWFGHKPDLSLLRIFGCIAFAFIPSTKRSKLDPKSQQCLFLGYDLQSKAYRLQRISDKRIILSRDVRFFEHLTAHNLSEFNSSKDDTSTLDLLTDPDFYTASSPTEPVQLSSNVPPVSSNPAV